MIIFNRIAARLLAVLMKCLRDPETVLFVEETFIFQTAGQSRGNS